MNRYIIATQEYEAAAIRATDAYAVADAAHAAAYQAIDLKWAAAEKAIALKCGAAPSDGDLDWSDTAQNLSSLDSCPNSETT